MGWVTLSLRKHTLRSQINDFELQDITLSRQLRTVQRHLAYDKSILHTDKKSEIDEAKKPYKEAIQNRPKVSDPTYAEWEANYTEVKQKFEEDRNDIEDYYESKVSELEDESTDRENQIQEQQTSLESELEAMRQELESVTEQISNDIQNTKINFK